MVMHPKIPISNGKNSMELTSIIQTGNMDIQEHIRAS